MVVFDSSSSMGYSMGNSKTRLENAKYALSQVLTTLPPNTEIGITTFSNTITPIMPVGNDLVSKINGIEASGGTPLGAYMKVGADLLLRKRAEERYGNYKLLVITDGESGDAFQDYLDDILSRGIVVNCIGLDMAKEHSLATKVDNYCTANDVKTLIESVQRFVKAETIADPATNQADYDLLEGFPTDVAQVCLEQLAINNDIPIGEIATPVMQDGNLQTNPDGSIVFEEPRSILWVVLTVFVVFLVLVGVVLLIAGS